MPVNGQNITARLILSFIKLAIYTCIVLVPAREHRYIVDNLACVRVCVILKFVNYYQIHWRDLRTIFTHSPHL